jgi:hypothetical protein
MKFIQSNQEYLRKYQTALQQSKLSPNSTILPLNSIEFEGKAIKGEQLDEHFAMGLAICESIFYSPLAQAMLQLDLGHAHKKGYDAIQHASERYAYLEDKQKQGGVTNLPNFNSQPPTSNFDKPGTPQYRDNLEQKRLAGLKQTRLDTDEALEKSVAQKIGDYNTPTKDEILKVGGRPEAEKFINNFKESP